MDIWYRYLIFIFIYHYKKKIEKRVTIVDGDIKLNHRQFIQRLQRSDQKGIYWNIK